MTLWRVAVQAWVVGVGMTCAAAAMAQPPASAVRISVSSSGEQGNHFSIRPEISETGRFVIFVSAASNLVPGDTNNDLDLFLHDRDTDADGVFDEPGAISTIRVNERPGVEPDGQVIEGRITPDGRYVVFVSYGSNVVAPGTPAGIHQVYRFDRVTGELQLVSRGVTGEPGNAMSHEPAISDDGRLVAFYSTAYNLMPGDQISENKGIYLRDMTAGTLIRLSEWSALGPTAIEARWPSMSSDGTVILFSEARITYTNGRQVETGLTLVNRATGEVRRRFAPGNQARLTRDGAAFVAFDNLFTAPAAQTPVYWQHIATGERRVGTVETAGRSVGAISAMGRYVEIEGSTGPTFEDFRYRSNIPAPFAIDTVGFSVDDRWMAVGTHLALGPPGQDTNDKTDVYVMATADAFDTDRDGLDDGWERFFGLSTSISGPATDTATGDSDGDGLTNAQELAAGSHPRGISTRYLAEGATGSFFETRLALANACDCSATAIVRFEKEDGTSASRVVPLPARSRATLVASATDVGAASFSTVVESDHPLAVDRLMTWDRGGYGSHAEASLEAPSTSWFLAEGTTSAGFQLFYLLQNPRTAPVTATVRFLLPSGDPILRTYDLSPGSRKTIVVNEIAGLEATDVSAEVTASQPIVVERAMYRSKFPHVFALGHAAAGVPAASRTWFLAEGATGTFFDTYVLIANPSAAAVSVTMEFLRQDGVTVTQTRSMAPGSRQTVFVDAVPGLEETTFGARIQSTVPVVVERAMYWAGGFYDYYEGHVSAGATDTSRNWLLAEGEVGGPLNNDTYVLIANTSNEAVTVAVTALPQNDVRLAAVPATPHNLVIGANSRVTVALSTLVPANSKAGVEVRQMDGASAALVVEGAIYSSTRGLFWSAGAALPATRF